MMQALLEETFNLAPVRDRAASFRVGGAKEECVKENFFWGEGEHACGFLFNLSKVMENANNDKTIDFFPHLQ